MIIQSKEDFLKLKIGNILEWQEDGPHSPIHWHKISEIEGFTHDEQRFRTFGTKKDGTSDERSFLVDYFIKSRELKVTNNKITLKDMLS
jgi:hypothetical protein